MQLRNLLGALALSSTAAATYNLQQVYQFQNSFSGVGFVNAENLVVRSTNGQMLITTVTEAILAQLNSDNPVAAELIVNLTDATSGRPGSMTGILETAKDVYTVAAGNFAFGPQIPGGIAGIPGSFSIWNIDLNGPKAKASKLVDIPEAGALNGIAPKPGKGNHEYVLVADSGLGAIWQVNVKTGAYSQYYANALLAPNPYFQLGINGLKTTDKYVYFTNSATYLFGAIPVGSNGHPSGDAQPLAYAPQGYSFDDFSFDKYGNAYVAGPAENGPGAVFKILSGNPNPVVIANSSLLIGPTSTVFRGPDLYITTGGAGGPMPISGGVFKISNAAGIQKRYMERS